MRARVVFAGAACAALIVACGGSSGGGPSGGGRAQTSGARYGPRNSPYALSRCMRANGLSHFPDPAQGSGGIGFPGGLTLAMGGQLTVDGVTFSGPALKRASRVCRAYLPGGSGPPPPFTSTQNEQALRFAHCMRAEGVPSFPDPPSGGPGAGAGAAAPPPRALRDSPAFRHAAAVCGRRYQFRVRAGNLQGP